MGMKKRTPEQNRAAQAAYRLRHPDRVAARKKAWKRATPQKQLEHARSYRARHPEKYAAHKAVTIAIDNGSLVPQPCEVCGSVEVEAHHDDYSKPLEVRWFCKPHHLSHHRG